MEPYNYMQGMTNPFAQALSGVQQGIALAGAMDQAKIRELQSMKLQQEMQQNQQMQQDMIALANNPNPTAKDFAMLSARHPQMAEHYKSAWGMMSQERRDSNLQYAQQVYSALQADKPDIAKNILERQYNAYQNSKMFDDAQHTKAMMDLLDADPRFAKNAAGMMLASVMGPEKFASTFETLQKLPGEVAQGQATAIQKQYEAANTPERLALENMFKGSEIRNLDSTIAKRAADAGLDRDKLQTETQVKMVEIGQKYGQLPDDARKLVNESVVNSTAASHTANQMNDLASKLEAERSAGKGLMTNAAEGLKRITGNQDYLTGLRQEYIRLRNSEVIKTLAPGTASDRDVSIAMSGFPPESADVQYMAQFLKGMAKLNNYAAEAENAKAEWVGVNQHLGKSKQDSSIGGVQVPAGTTFPQFVDKYMDQFAAKRNEKSQLQNRSYMRFATGTGEQ